MIVIPAIDIIEGQAVRLYKGDYSKKEIIGQKIMDIAKYFNEIGAGAIHMVDLDGAKEGHMVNGEIITKVARLVDVPVEAGGGIRTYEDIEYLIENGVSKVILGTSAIENQELLIKAVKKFREDVNLSSEAKVDTNTWMALLLSKGNPDRTCTACDTNQRLDQDKINYLKTNGYYLVGRYLANSAKGITRDEAELILDNNMKFFPIFQSSGLDESISSFTLNRADQDAISALAYAKNLGLPQRTIIYFAVDYDATDYDISEYVLPYFKSLYNKVKNEYKVGIYGTRNVCTKVMSAGYATTCFVSDMSTGYSGNMGFKMPSDWNLDQFASVSTTVEGKKFKFDKVSYKGNYAIVTSLVEPVNIDPIYNVTEGEFVLDKDYPVNIGTARKFSGRYLKLNIKVTGKDGEILNDGTAVRISLMKTESNDGDPYMDLLPLIVPNVKANGTIYTAANFSIKDRDYIIIDDIHHYYLKYELMNPDTSKSVRIKVIMESYTD